MPDNVNYEPNASIKIASREVTYSGDTAQAQSVGLVTFSGNNDAKNATDVDQNNPLPVVAYGELLEAIEAMRFAIAQLTRTIGFALPNASGQPMFEARQGTAANLQTTATQAGTWNVATVTTVSTVTNQSQVGALSANHLVPAFMNTDAATLRRNIAAT
jgi:hypothetical protein